ncbi:DUF4306 domain-containing protein [Sporosarcina sp. resist]|uniref:DUF4306 domain-containing protein n=1 Tax=Sporosarcina sp. resist TaxID=2762563 RepID=UPI00164E7B5B|nr:DUF4306 domain-containing protein [Sporosarcina sp. resist]QNK89582.1 DUF4306 domain-containing protein [Sporosarcina sp. resist]
MKKIIIFIFLLLAFVYSFFLTSWSGSYIMIEEDWKNHIVFTPEKVTEPQQIYEIDKFVYAFKIDPLLSMVCVLSFLTLIGFIVFWISKKFHHKTKVY